MLSFFYALQGLISAWHSEKNLRFHLITSVIVIILSIFLNLQRWEWISIIICMAMVIIMELVNTAIEELCNAVTIQKHPLIKKAKDIAAAAVLLCAVAAFAVGCIIFLPYLYYAFDSK